MFWIYGSNFAPPLEALKGGGAKKIAHILPPPLDFFLYTPLYFLLKTFPFTYIKLNQVHDINFN